MLLIVVGILGLTSCTQSQENNLEVSELVIGAIMPLSGDAAAYGIPLQQAVTFAVEEINRNGGVNGKTLKVVYEDGECTAKGGSAAAQKLIGIDNVKVILGGLCSGETLGAAPIAQNAQVILFSSASGSPDITTAGDYIFRNFPSDATSASKVALTALENEHTNIAIFAEQTDFPQALREVFKTSLLKEKGTIAVEESFASDTTDFKAALTKIKESDADGIYVVTQTPATYGLVLKQLKEMGINQQIYTNELAAAQDILDGYTEEIEGAIYAEPEFDENAQQAKTLMGKLESRYGDLSGAVPRVYFATTYDAVYILKEALSTCGDDTTCLKDNLYSVENRVGTAGTLSIDNNGDALFEYEVKQIVDGQATTI